MVSPQMVSQVTAALVDFTAKAIAQVVVVSISPFCGSESESGESQQAVERLTATYQRGLDEVGRWAELARSADFADVSASARPI